MIPHWAPPTHAMQIWRYAEQGSIELLWISATNPARLAGRIDGSLGPGGVGQTARLLAPGGAGQDDVGQLGGLGHEQVLHDHEQFLTPQDAADALQVGLLRAERRAPP